ncbi:unnamed protein product [Sphenostylis stenocarpa]|uniref:Uncharacterized protein n=1 Tax=Sphenostylis stenocarpa TaxID=92480 RepID=A0AA86W3J8_9FABA|nr:unnamed protein product [Sphenostylis stenocarpa]
MCGSHDHLTFDYKRGTLPQISNHSYSKLFFATTHQNLIPPQMTPKMFACIYDNGDMIPNPKNGVLFKSDTCIMVQLHGGFTFSQLVEIILQRGKEIQPIHLLSSISDFQHKFVADM